jgi:hypothetical protein
MYEITVAKREIKIFCFEKWWWVIDEYKPSKEDGFTQIGNSKWFFKKPKFKFKISFEVNLK